jgi:biotin carboxylase
MCVHVRDQFADSQFGHLFAWGETREESRKNMLLALKELSVRGDVRTPVEVLIHILASSDFRNSQVTCPSSSSSSSSR